VSGLRTRLSKIAITLAYAAPAALVAWGLWLGATSPEASGQVLRLGHSLNRDHPVHKGMEFMAEDLERRSGGLLKIEIYADGQLGPERDLIELIQIGSLAMTKVSTAPLENFSPLIKVFSLPYLFRDQQHFWEMANGPIGRELLDASMPYRLKGLCYFDAGARSFYISRKRNKVVRHPDDLDGLSIRVQRSRTAVRLVELLGAKPVPIPFGELYTALDTGTVDGAENNPPSLYTTRQYEVTAAYTLNEHTMVPDILIIGVDTWNRLSPEEQGWLQASADAASIHERKLWAEAEAEMLQIIEDSGVLVVRDVDREAFRARTAPMYEDEEFAQPEVRDLIQRIRAVGALREAPAMVEGETS
jgi:tripartite ATP-independent transporter DctP family solute receptor